MKVFNMKDLLLEDNPILREPSKLVEMPLSQDDFETLQEMAAFVMESQTKELDANGDKYRPAIGLSAVQLGILKQMFVIVTTDDDLDLFVMAVVNPRIEKESQNLISLTDGEGCLSVQSVDSAKVPRREWVRWSGTLVDLETGETARKTLSKIDGYLGVVFQHEYDHLAGVLFTDITNPKIEKEPAENV